MTQSMIEFIGLSFVLKLAAAWGVVTTVASLAIAGRQQLVTHTRRSMRDRRAAIVRNYPE